MHPTPFTYSDLLHPDGTTNTAAFEFIVASRVFAEIDRRLCSAAGLRPPRIPLGDCRAWYAAQVKAHRLGPIGDEERHRIAKDARREIESWVATMKVGAERQRKAMRAGEFLDAAE